MNLCTIAPSSQLSMHIKQYWFLEMEAHEAVGERIVPTGYIELTFHFAQTLIQRKHSDNLQPSVIISGQKTGFFDVIPTGKTSMLSIQFYPHSASLFFDLSLSELTNETLNFTDLVGAPARELEEQLHALPTLNQKVAHIEQFLLLRLAHSAAYTWKRIAHNISIINQNNGNITPEQLASEACLSRKQHERVFKQMIGLSPKQFLKIIRFQYSIYAHQQFPNENLTELAYRCGFYDQSHMINDFRELTGITPKQYFNDCNNPISDYF